MDLIFLADKTEAIPIVARWYFGEWGHKIYNNSVEKICGRLNGNLNREKAPLYVLAVEFESIVGVAQLKIREMDIYPDKEYWLGSVFVPSGSRGKGIASALSLRMAETATQFGADKIHLQTEMLNGGLYAKLGWKPFEQVHYNGLDVLVMEKELCV